MKIDRHLKLKRLMRYFVAIILLFITTISFGQQVTALEDVVKLKNGSIVRGKILEYKPSETIKVEILGGSVLVYPSSEVIEITKEETVSTYTPHTPKRLQRPVHVPEDGRFWNQFSTRLMIGAGGFGNIAGGIGGYYTGGYQFNQHHGVGVGVGIERNYLYNIIPIHLTYRGYFMKTSASLYYNLDLGYNLVLGGGNWRQNVVSSDGGIYAFPSLGFRFKSRRKTHLTMEVGISIQGLHNTQLQDWGWGWGGEPINRVISTVMYRPSFKIGYMF